ncbi:hypothetical protein BpHYR1_049005 [Brachionus plicatilis]|uniref:Uncharacterized protein n=1 Tax=Brachionus plicatilis TaxID=10195 RepID=A0A3M7T6P5_BRAPC|nr:hypothetical protein BpHYR1_049005 [Brachionus plicatilis]
MYADKYLGRSVCLLESIFELVYTAIKYSAKTIFAVCLSINQTFFKQKFSGISRANFSRTLLILGAIFPSTLESSLVKLAILIKFIGKKV